MAAEQCLTATYFSFENYRETVERNTFARKILANPTGSKTKSREHAQKQL